MGGLGLRDDIPVAGTGELLPHRHTRPCGKADQRGHLSAHVEQRSVDQPAIGGAQTTGLTHGVDPAHVRGEIRGQDAFGRTGRAGGEVHGVHVPGFEGRVEHGFRDGPGAQLSRGHRDDVEPEPDQPLTEDTVGDDHRSARLGTDMPETLPAVGDVHGHHHRAQGADPPPGAQPVEPVRQKEQNVVTTADSTCRQCRRRPVSFIKRLLPSPSLVIGAEHAERIWLLDSVSFQDGSGHHAVAGGKRLFCWVQRRRHVVRPRRLFIGATSHAGRRQPPPRRTAVPAAPARGTRSAGTSPRSPRSSGHA